MFNGNDFVSLLGHRIPIQQVIVQQTGTDPIPIVESKGPGNKIIMLSLMIASPAQRNLLITDGATQAAILQPANSTIIYTSPFGFFVSAPGRGIYVTSQTPSGNCFITARFVVIPDREN
jgi:hypothetical protein